MIPKPIKFDKDSGDGNGDFDAKKSIEDLQAQITAMAESNKTLAGTLKGISEGLTAIRSDMSTKDKETRNTPSSTIQEYVSGDNFDAVISDPHEFNKMMTSMQDNISKSVVASLSQELPKAVSGMMGRYMGEQNFYGDMYKAFPKLQQHDKYVRFVAEDVANTNKDITPEKLQEMVVDRIASELKTDKEKFKEDKEPTGGTKNPAFANTPGSRGPSFEDTDDASQEAQMGKMIDFIEKRERGE